METTIDTNEFSVNVVQSRNHQKIGTPAYTFDDVQIIPRRSRIKSRSDVDTSFKISDDLSLTVPVIASPMDTVVGFEMAEAIHRAGGVACLHRFDSIENQVKQFEDLIKNDDQAFCAVGIRNHDRIIALNEAGCKHMIIDVAHGHHHDVIETVKYIKAINSEIYVMAGNVATGEGAVDLAMAGADAIRVGIGNGSVCETRIRTGVGVPQVSAIIDVEESLYKIGKRPDVHIVADGGCRYIGDIAKALAAGADYVMLGSMFAGTDEAPGEVIEQGIFPHVRRYKQYRGSASRASKAERGEATHIEGNSKLNECKGPVNRIIEKIHDGVRSSFSYVGATNMNEFHSNAMFRIVTQSGSTEGKPHGLLK